MTSSQRRKAVRFSVSAINAAHEKIIQTITELLVLTGLSVQDARALAMTRAKDIRIQCGNIAVAHMAHEEET